MAHSRVLVVNGSYREDGITDQAVAAAADALREAGAETRVVNLRDYPIEFCTNCRQCALAPGSEPGRCVIDDGMHELIARIEESDAFILAAPTNFGSVTAIFKRFMERLMPYGYWPWEKPSPVPRRTGKPRKKALLISSSAAPAWMGSWLFGSNRQLAMAAKVIGAHPVGKLFTGLAAKSPDQDLPAKSVERARRLARRLVED
jgi:multimeric flavodoxin WrbA